jgi:hypothetical protein
VAETEKALACTTSFADIRDGIVAITNSSELGYAMFSKRLAEAGSVDVDQLIRQEMLAIVKAKITKESLGASRARFVNLMKTLARSPLRRSQQRTS